MFEDDIKEFSERAKAIKKNIKTEEATKTSLIMPMFQLLGYDIFNTTEFCPEFTADVGVKKGERVDYAIFRDGDVEILIECKSCTDSFDSTESVEKYANQLYRYFNATPAKIGILTNGLIYKFYSDIEKPNVMDLSPFLEIDLLKLKDIHITELERFCKENFNRTEIVNNAEDLKCAASIKDRLASLLSEPDDEFVKLMISDFYNGVKTQKILDKYRPIVKQAFTKFITDLMTSRFTAAISEPEIANENDTSIDDNNVSKIVTTEMEIEAFYIIRGMLVGTVPIEDIFFRDTESYFGVLYKDNNRKPICRLILEGNKPQILIPDENKNFSRIYITDLNQLYKLKNKLIKVVKRYTSD